MSNKNRIGKLLRSELVCKHDDVDILGGTERRGDVMMVELEYRCVKCGKEFSIEDVSVVDGKTLKFAIRPREKLDGDAIIAEATK